MKDTNNRVRAVIRNGSKILCFRANNNNRKYSTKNYFFFFFHIKKNECSYDAIIRELKEEIDGISSILSCNILGVFELKWYDITYVSHTEINFVYEIQVTYINSPNEIKTMDNYLDAEWIEETDIKSGQIILLPSEISENINLWSSIDSNIRSQVVFSSGF